MLVDQEDSYICALSDGAEGLFQGAYFRIRFHDEKVLPLSRPVPDARQHEACHRVLSVVEVNE